MSNGDDERARELESLDPEHLVDTLEDLLDGPVTIDSAGDLAAAFGAYLTDVLPPPVEFVLVVGVGGHPCGVSASAALGHDDLITYLERLAANLREKKPVLVDRTPPPKPVGDA